ncbi:MAG: EAL domain-containing protein (putative c-di-GMP-specific phosphodiesterase class I) [Pseudohongiellaceae bacterium]|jgi:EAL domain-containing protein (putative c-di-GMP-specific phosphodiesterase class I)
MGYSSLSYLTQLPIDKFKIDQSIARKISTDDRNSRIVETIISMSKNLSLQVIAEGVETESERHFLLKHGCNQF